MWKRTRQRLMGKGMCPCGDYIRRKKGKRRKRRERNLTPFTKEELEKKIGPFRSSPIQIAVVDNGPDLPPKYRCCRNLSFKGSSDASINNLIGSENFHTRWYTAVECAKIVRHHNHYQAFIHVYMASTIIRRPC